MSNKANITFILDESLKTRFEERAKELDMTVSYALRKLMIAFLEDNRIIAQSMGELSQKIEERLTRLSEQQKRDFDERLVKLDTILIQARNQITSKNQERTQTIAEEVFNLLVKDPGVRRKYYSDTEKAIVHLDPSLKYRIEEAKRKGDDPVSDAINRCRAENICSYNFKSKYINWRD